MRPVTKTARSSTSTRAAPERSRTEERAPAPAASTEVAALRLNRMYAALSATNEAILRATSVEDLYQRVCDAAVHGGKFNTTAVIVPVAGSSVGQIAGLSGVGKRALRETRFSLDPATPEGRAAIGTAFSTRKTAVVNDYQNDERTKPWHESAKKVGIGSNAAIPLLRDGRAIGVLLLYSAEKNAFDDEICKLLERMAENVVFALDNFDHEAERRHSAEAAVRLGRMYAALSATNEAIMQARSPEELYQRVCDAVAARGGRFLSALIFLAQPSSPWLKQAAVSSKTNRAQLSQNPRVSIDPAHPEGRGSTGQAFREQRPIVLNDYMNDERTIPWRKAMEGTGVRGMASLPIIRGGQSIGALLMYAREVNSFDDETVKLLERITENLAFALDNFDHAAERRAAENAVRESEARFRALTKLSSDWYWEQDAEFRYTRVESYRGDEPPDGHSHLGKHGWETGYVPESLGGWEERRRLLEAHQPYRDVVMYRVNPDGTRRYISMSGEPVFDVDGRFRGYRGVSREITDKRRAEERIEYLATHDALTGLPNRVMFSQVLHLAIASAQRYQRGLAVLLIDLDRFKIINETLGHEAGDNVLKEMSVRLKNCLRTSDVVARLGGDEFVVLLQDIDEGSEISTVARKILSTLMKPINVRGQECRLTASLGICSYPGDGVDEQSLMKNADSAMYLAKEEGKNNFQFYSHHMNNQSLERLTLETSLQGALERNEFALHYQPKVDLRTGAISGVEALIRWKSSMGLVSPAQFIPLAEETGLIVPIGRWVLRTACQQNVEWQRAGLPPMRMAVNLSARQFGDENLLADIRTALADSGMRPELLELEITEGMVMKNADRALKLIGSLKEMGVYLAIDDFGTGYSSLAQLKRFPIDTLKIDRSFIRDIPDDAEDKAITEAIIAMGRSLNLTIVAEGVETEAQAAFLREHACDEMQGYYFSKPIVAEDLATMLREQVSAGDPRIVSLTAR
jgi:diguanylate cyclase (GGDEF)-like protein